ncbi:dihydrodipicolinate synthase family protein [Haloarchaeobius sp. TZWSO28]|uniref:dihydrodipicolinate synthase family protein n=1 Tax=Haloarchaeobius sp. TZWSO28 TaxID=3446119 RepID=UPI003EB9CF70
MQYRQLSGEFSTVCFTTATPFSADGSEVDHEELSANLSWMADAGARVFIACGNTGEYYSLSTDERVAVVETHVEEVGDRGTVVGGVGGSTKDAIALIEAYEDAGADAIMVTNPDHTHIHERGLVEYYERLAASTDLGLVPYKRGPEISHSVLMELTTIENIVAVKYAVPDLNAFARAVQESPGDVTWVNGIAERYALSFAIEGATGYTTGIGNFAPESTLELHAAVQNGEWDRARRLRAPLQLFEELRADTGPDNALSAANSVSAVKYGMELAGLYGGPVREPLVDLAADDQRRADELFEAIESTT